jgi:hypothetical protein
MQKGFLSFSFISLIAACAGLGTALAQSSRVVITPEPGYTITWDGNNGGFSSPEPARDRRTIWLSPAMARLRLAAPKLA